MWTPTTYEDDPKQRFPVVYLQDGQNLFDAASSFAGVAWQADITAQRLIVAHEIAPLLLVGIDNSGEGRADDYAPVPWRSKGGRAEDFANMLVDEIKPFVDKNYRTRPEPKATAVGGSSLGGLFSLCTGLRRADVFGHVAAMSPSVFWGNHQVLRTVAKSSRVPVRIWLDVGKHETPTLRTGARKLAEMLLGKGWKKHRNAGDASLRFTEVADGRHDEASWGRRFGRVLKFLFPLGVAAS